MKSHSVVVILLIFVAVILDGAGKLWSSGLDITLQSLYPLHLGNSWTMQIVNYNMLTGILESTDTSKMTIDSIIEIKGLVGYRVEDRGSYQSMYYYSNNRAYYSDLTLEYVRPVLQYPMQIGETSIFEDTIDRSGRHKKSTSTLVSLQEQITVPAGMFMATHFRVVTFYVNSPMNDTIAIGEEYYAPNVGMVSFENTSVARKFGRHIVNRGKLIRYRIN